MTNFLNISIPHFYCYLRNEFLYNQTKGFEEYTKVAVFGATSVQGRAVMFSCMTERGAQIDRLPVSAFCHIPESSRRSQDLDYLELWDCFSYHMSCTQYEYLKGLHCSVLMKDKTWFNGIYMMTFDWAMSSYAEDAGEGGHKCGHMIQLDPGNYCIMPNNRILWREPSFITNPYPLTERPDFITNEHNWKCENGLKWYPENSNAMFYGDGNSNA